MNSCGKCNGDFVTFVDHGGGIAAHACIPGVRIGAGATDRRDFKFDRRRCASAFDLFALRLFADAQRPDGAWDDGDGNRSCRYGRTGTIFDLCPVRVCTVC